jgi:hypothetical protein
MAVIQVNRKGDIDNDVEVLKIHYKQNTKSGAIETLVKDFVRIKIAEIDRLKRIEKKYNEITGILEQKVNLDNQLKLCI